MKIFRETLSHFHEKHWPETSWEVKTGGNKLGDENYYFARNNALFIGLNLVTGVEHDIGEAAWRTSQMLQWIDKLYRESKKKVKHFVMFQHAAPPGEGENIIFFKSLFKRIKENYRDMSFLLVHKSGKNNFYDIDRNYEGIENLNVVSVLGPIWPPLQITLNTTAMGNNSVTLNHDEWYDSLL